LPHCVFFLLTASASASGFFQIYFKATFYGTLIFSSSYLSLKMGVLQDVAGPLSQQFSQLGLGVQIGAVFATVVFLSVFVNVLKQALFRNPNEPPVVFHWFPLIGSTVTYGMDPPRFFDENRKKVRICVFLLARLGLADLEGGDSTAMFLRLFCSARRRRSMWERRATTLF
jgi:hypothetical protein